MALFIEIEVSAAAARDPKLVADLVQVCPVDIFAADGAGGLAIVERNLDECTLCELCLRVAPPGSLRVLKLYDDRRPLERTA
jgi:NAD-dependent dihydropyrimidine dehydrogenase PreA subunit